MKKQLLFVSAALLGTSSMFAQLPDPGDRNTVTYSTNLSLEWYAAPTGTCSDAAIARSGIGVNGKFYITMLGKGVSVYAKDGQIKTIDNKDTWVSINVDDAGHVYFRNDIDGKDFVANAGWYYPDKARFCVIDSKTDELIATDIPMQDGFKGRFDALPHIYGDMVTGTIEMPVPVNGIDGKGYVFIYSQLEQTGFDKFDIINAIKAGGFPAPANTVLTLGSCQQFEPDEDDFPLKMAVLVTNHVEETGSWFGWGNNIALYNRNMLTEGFEFSGKWLNTPSHSAIGGFCMFSYAGKNYICYPAGTTPDGFPSGDGFFVMEEELVDSPKNMTPTEENTDWSEQIHKAIAYKYATDGIKTGNNYRGINVEPVEGEDGKFTIYHYNPGVSMEVWTLDLSGNAGINDIVDDKGAAKIFGGVGVVIVDGAAKAQVYSIDGALVAEGAGSIAVPAGVYVVKAGTTAAKVIVK